jgi:hypothetical protein
MVRRERLRRSWAAPSAASWGALGLLLPLAALAASCSKDRASTAQSPVFVDDVSPILEQRCVRCHAGPKAAAGWDATSYLGAIACVAPSGAPATLPSSDRAPILSALATGPHPGLLDAGELATLEAWVTGGAPARVGGVHARGIVDPRSAGWHGTLLRAARWSPMLDTNDPQACGTCHEGTPAGRPAGVTLAAPGATACTTCHTEPAGVLACSTCHGEATRSYPPRDLCFFPGDSVPAGAHAAHLLPSPALTTGVPCSSCHPIPGTPLIGALHGNGNVDIAFDPRFVTPPTSTSTTTTPTPFDRSTLGCTVGCHDVGGARPRPLWTDPKPMGCNDCHGAPPVAHPAGPCTNCHSEANANGTALTPGPLHLNGRIDFGDGTGQTP